MTEAYLARVDQLYLEPSNARHGSVANSLLQRTELWRQPFRVAKFAMENAQDKPDGNRKSNVDADIRAGVQEVFRVQVRGLNSEGRWSLAHDNQAFKFCRWLRISMVF